MTHDEIRTEFKRRFNRDTLASDFGLKVAQDLAPAGFQMDCVVGTLRTAEMSAHLTIGDWFGRTGIDYPGTLADAVEAFFQEVEGCVTAFGFRARMTERLLRKFAH